LRAIAVLVVLAVPGSFPWAADLYRWVDESGRTHITDTVPEQYRKSATRIDTRQFEATSEQRREAEERAERERARVRAIQEERARGARPAAAPAAAPRQAAAADCAELHRRYRESLDCFAPYIQANGTTKAEAYSKCAVVKDPSPECGPPGSRESTSRSVR
jgi:hypothetical protein